MRLNLEIDNIAEAEPVINVEGNMCGTVMRGIGVLGIILIVIVVLLLMGRL